MRHPVKVQPEERATRLLQQIMESPCFKRTAQIQDFRGGGITLNAGRGGERIDILTRALVTSDDGPHMFQYLESMTRTMLAPLFQGLELESIQSFLINITDSTQAVAWFNPVVLRQNVIARRAIKPGQAVFVDDLAHVHEVELSGVDPMPSEGAII